MLTDKEKYAFLSGFAKGFLENLERNDASSLLAMNYMLRNLCKRFELPEEMTKSMQEDLIGLYTDMVEFCKIPYDKKALDDYLSKLMRRE